MHHVTTHWSQAVHSNWSELVFGYYQVSSLVWMFLGSSLVENARFFSANFCGYTNSFIQGLKVLWGEDVVLLSLRRCYPSWVQAAPGLRLWCPLFVVMWSSSWYHYLKPPFVVILFIYIFSSRLDHRYKCVLEIIYTKPFERWWNFYPGGVSFCPVFQGGRLPPASYKYSHPGLRTLRSQIPLSWCTSMSIVYGPMVLMVLWSYGTLLAHPIST